jgi:hypothetical protein
MPHFAYESILATRRPINNLHSSERKLCGVGIAVSCWLYCTIMTECSVMGHRPLWILDKIDFRLIWRPNFLFRTEETAFGTCHGQSFIHELCQIVFTSITHHMPWTLGHNSTVLQPTDLDLVSDWMGGINFLPLDLLSLGSSSGRARFSSACGCTPDLDHCLAQHCLPYCVMVVQRCPIWVPSRFEPYTATAQLTPYFTIFYGYKYSCHCLSILHYYNLLWIFYYNLRSAASHGWDADFK